MEPNRALIITGATANAGCYTGTITGPSSFGSGGFFYGSTSPGTGPVAGISGADPFVYLPIDYVDNTPLSDTATYYSATFASLGVTTGTYVWTWGSGANQSFTLKIGQTPCCQTILRLLGLLGWRRKRKAQTI